MCDKESGRVLRLSKDSLWEKIDNLVEQYKPVNLSKVCFLWFEIVWLYWELFFKLLLFYQGFPNWKPPSFILDAAVKGIQELNINQYTRSSGFPPLLEELAKYEYILHNNNIIIIIYICRKYSSQFNRSIDHQKEVLFVLDGLKVGKYSEVANLIGNSDIEAINILKEPSDLALYGFIGSGGVVLIKTK